MFEPAKESFAKVGRARPVGPARSARDLLPVALGFALVMGLVIRATSGWTAPIWLDENFSLVIASQPDFSHLLSWMLHELSGPVYYFSLWVWGLLFGHGDIAMRIPSFICSVAAPLVVLFGDHADRRTRMIWAGLLALWSHSLGQATEARPYPVITLLACAQTMAYLRLLKAPSTGRATLWLSVCGLSMLTHYYTIPIVGLQGLLYLASAPRAALRSWPALLVMLPVVGWMGFHLPFVLGFAQSGQTWYRYVSPASLIFLPEALFGFALLIYPLTIGMVISGVAGLVGLARGTAVLTPERRAYALTMASAMIAVLVVVSAAMVARSFTTRYLVPFGPPALLGMAWWLGECDKRQSGHLSGHLSGRVSAIVLAMLTGLSFGTLYTQLAHPERDRRTLFTFQPASRWFVEEGAVKRLVFFWDSPSADFSDRAHLAEVGSYFLRRAGADPEVIVPAMPADADPNPRLLALAGRQEGTAIIWGYDKNVPLTRGNVYPARLTTIDPAWTCRNFGRDNMTLLACVRH